MVGRWFVGAVTLSACVGLGCGPAVGNTETGGGGSGQGSSEGDASSGMDETGETQAGCPQVLLHGSVGAMSPVIHEGYGYWSQLDGTVWRVELGTDIGVPEPVAAPAGPYTSLLADAGRLLLVGDQTLSWHVFSDATTHLLAEGQQSPLSPALWNERLLWLNYGSGILAGELMSVAASDPTAEPSVVLDGLGTPRSLVADASTAYVIAQQAPDRLDGALLEVDPVSGTTLVRADDMDSPGELALTSDRIIWVEHGILAAGRVRAVAKGNDEPAVTLDTVNEGMPITVAADQAAIYYGVFGSSEASVMRLDASSNERTLVATWPSAVVDVAVSPTYLLVTANPVEATVEPVDGVTVFCRE